ncbi:MAG: hypothetical protein C3F15_07150 [Holophagae bacterium]|nr:MAG: hypothetical protein C3F15_07150 [Holophagae bacterium]
MSRSRAKVAGSLAVAVLALLLSACAPASDSADGPQPALPTPPPAQASPKPPRAVLDDGFVIRLELALTPDEITQGLMFRPSLADNRGMLFLFEVDRVPSFWMKHTMIPLDLLFLDGQGAIVDLVENAQPCAAEPCPQYIPSRAVSAVLEVSAGTAARHGLAIGDRIGFKRVPGYPR